MVLTLKALLSVIAVIAAWRLQTFAERADISNRHYDRIMFGTLVAIRLGVFAVIFVAFDVTPQSDVTVYYAEALVTRGGAVPLVGVDTAYGPGFDYVVAAAVSVWRDNRALVLLTILVELGSFPVWMRVGRGSFAEVEARRAALSYVANPLAISTVAIAGQNHVWLSLFLALSLLAIMHEKDGLGGLALGASIAAVKFLSALFAPILFLAARRRAIWAAAFCGPPLIAYTIVAGLGAQPWRQVMFHALHTSSGNLPFLLSAVGLTLSAPDERFVADGAAFFLLCAVFLLAVRKFGLPKGSLAVAMCAFVLVVTLLVQKKAFASYLVIALFPLCLAMAAHARPRRAAMSVQALSVLATLEPSLWFRWLHQNDLSVVFQATLPEGFVRFELVAFLACEIALIGGYAALLALLWRAMAQLSRRDAISICDEDARLAPSPRMWPAAGED